MAADLMISSRVGSTIFWAGDSQYCSASASASARSIVPVRGDDGGHVDGYQFDAGQLL